MRYSKNRKIPQTAITIIFSLALLFFSNAIYAEEKPKPPQQPASGPGGRDYKHAGVTKNVYGQGGTHYWLYEPAEPKPESAPVVVILCGNNPGTKGAWIEHLVRRGNIVIWPMYFSLKPLSLMQEDAISAIKNAILCLKQEGHVKPELDKFAITGHSQGGTMTANISALAKEKGLPQPKAIMPVQPGIGILALHPDRRFKLEDFTKISKDTLMVIVVGDNDEHIAGAGETTPEKIFYGTSQILLSNKNLITLVSDYHGDPPLAADHFSPMAPDERYGTGDEIDKEEIAKFMKENRTKKLSLEERKKNLEVLRYFQKQRQQDRDKLRIVDALDYYGFWKLFDALCDATFSGKNREYALGNIPQQRYMGKWSDDTSVKELVVTNKP